MKDIELRKEFSSFCWGLTKVGDKWEFFWELFEKDDDKYINFKNKMNNLLILLNEDDSIILNKDIEDEIYDMI